MTLLYLIFSLLLLYSIITTIIIFNILNKQKLKSKDFSTLTSEELNIFLNYINFLKILYISNRDVDANKGLKDFSEYYLLLKSEGKIDFNTKNKIINKIKELKTLLISINSYKNSKITYIESILNEDKL